MTYKVYFERVKAQYEKEVLSGIRWKQHGHTNTTQSDITILLPKARKCFEKSLCVFCQADMSDSILSSVKFLSIKNHT